MLLAKQDALDQQQKIDCLILRGPFINNIGEVNTNYINSFEYYLKRIFLILKNFFCRFQRKNCQIWLLISWLQDVM